MRLFFAALVVSAMMWVGCVAVPDGDDVDRLRQQAIDVPFEVRRVIARWSSNRAAYKHMLPHHDERAGWVRCSDNVADIEIPIMAANILACLNQNLASSYDTCLDKLLDEQIAKYPGYNCSWWKLSTFAHPDTMPEETDAERVSDQSIVDLLLGPPPPLEIQLLLIAVPGFLGPSGTFCIQSKRNWACVDNPLDDASPGTSASSGGGDR